LSSTTAGDTIYTGVGTIGHSAMQLVIEEGFDSALAFLQDKEQSTPEMVEEIRKLGWAIEDARLWLPGLALPAISRAQAEEMGVRLWLEEQFELWLSSEDTMTGHVDLAELYQGTLDVLDWKFINQPSLMLPPLERHLQLLGYGLAIWRSLPEERIDRVRIRRVNGYTGRQELLELVPQQMGDIEALLAEIVSTIRGAQGQRRTGAQCLSCLWRRSCPDRSALGTSIDTTSIAPYSGGVITSDEDAMRFLLAQPVLEELLAEGHEAVKRYVVSKGGPLVDSRSNKQWGPRDQQGKREIVDVVSVIEELKHKIGGEPGKEAAYRLISTTLGKVEGELKAAKYKPKERAAFMDGLLESGFVRRGGATKVFSWSQIRRELGRGEDEEGGS
jgi:hypothetical protein